MSDEVRPDGPAERAAGPSAAPEALPLRRKFSRQAVAPEPVPAGEEELPEDQSAESAPRQRRKQGSESSASQSAAVPVPSKESAHRSSVGGGAIVSRIPAARGGKLLESERRLLSAEFALDKSDLFPRSRPLTSIAPGTRAPMLHMASEQYVELASTRRFKKLAAAAAAEQAEEHRRQMEAGSTPGAGAQVAMAAMGACTFGAQGVLAGVSVMQLFVVPGATVRELSLHLAYAPVAVQVHSALVFLALVSFIGAADVFAFDIRGARYATGIAVCSYAAATVLLAFELPLDFSLQNAYDVRREAIAAHLAAADGDPARFFFPRGNTTWFPFPGAPPVGLLVGPASSAPSLFDLDAERGSPLTSMLLSSSTISIWYALIIMRSIAVVVGWIALCLHASPRPYVLPPLPDQRGSMSETRPLAHG